MPPRVPVARAAVRRQRTERAIRPRLARRGPRSGAHGGCCRSLRGPRAPPAGRRRDHRGAVGRAAGVRRVVPVPRAGPGARHDRRRVGGRRRGRRPRAQPLDDVRRRVRRRDDGRSRVRPAHERRGARRRRRGDVQRAGAPPLPRPGPAQARARRRDGRRRGPRRRPARRLRQRRLPRGVPDRRRRRRHALARVLPGERRGPPPRCFRGAGRQRGQRRPLARASARAPRGQPHVPTGAVDDVAGRRRLRPRGA